MYFRKKKTTATGAVLRSRSILAVLICIGHIDNRRVRLLINARRSMPPISRQCKQTSSFVRNTLELDEQKKFFFLCILPRWSREIAICARALRPSRQRSNSTKWPTCEFSIEVRDDCPVVGWRSSTGPRPRDAHRDFHDDSTIHPRCIRHRSALYTFYFDYEKHIAYDTHRLRGRNWRAMRSGSRKVGRARLLPSIISAIPKGRAKPVSRGKICNSR